MYNPAEKLLKIYPYNLFAQIFQVGYNGVDSSFLYHLYPPALMDAVEKLDDRKKEIVKMHYLEGMTLERIGLRFSVTRERIRQVEAHAIRELRHPNLVHTYKFSFVPDFTVGVFERTLDKALDAITDIRSKTLSYEMDIPNFVDDYDYESVLNETEDLSEGISSLGISVRAYNLLMRSGVTCVRDLTMMSSAEILGLRNAGVKVLNEIKERLHAKGLKLADEPKTE